MKPGRLFWKLFLAFWLATTLTFLVGMGIMTLTRAGPGDPDLRSLLINGQRMVEQHGVEAGSQLLDVWARKSGEEVGLYDAQGRLIAGAEVPQPLFEKQLVSKEGAPLTLRSATLVKGEPEPGSFGSIPILVGTIMSALFSWLLALYLLRPLAHLRRAMSDVAQGRFETRVKPIMGRRRDEIVDLAEDCDRMANQLRLLVEAQQHLLHDISHELRSPLTRMQAAIGLLHQDPSRADMVGRFERESVRMDTLIEALLTLARVQGRPESIEREAVDITELLAHIVEDAQFEAGIKNCRVSLQAGAPFVCRVSGELLYRCFENVIRNALRYTGTGTDVRVVAQISLDDRNLRVRITDQGPGVEAERLLSIFEPFERGVNEPGNGFGLGLAIASRAVALHGGSISASNQPCGGLTVEINLPRHTV